MLEERSCARIQAHARYSDHLVGKPSEKGNFKVVSSGVIHLAHDTVKTKFGVDLELEVELVGEWGGQC